MLKLLPVLLISMLVTSKKTIADERWFQIEVITFVNPSNANNVNEKYPLIQMQNHVFDRELVSTDQKVISFQRYSQGFPVFSIVDNSVSYDPENGNEFVIQTGGITNLTDNSNSNQLNSSAESSDLKQQIEPQFVPLEHQDRLLRDKYRQLERSGRFQVLSFQAWRQHVGSENEAINIRINGGLNYNQKYDEQGYPRDSNLEDNLNSDSNEPSNQANFDQQSQRQTHDTRQEPSATYQKSSATYQEPSATQRPSATYQRPSAENQYYSGSEYSGTNANAIGFEAYQNPIDKFLKSRWNTRNEHDIWELDGSVQVYIKQRYLHLMTQLALREPAEFAKFNYLDQQRKQHSIESELQTTDQNVHDNSSEEGSISNVENLDDDEEQYNQETSSEIDNYLNSLTDNASAQSNRLLDNQSAERDNVAMQELAEIAALDEAISNKPKSGIVEYHLNTTRRLRSTEYHYIDHPKFGVLFLITPYTPNHLKQSND
jgi:hypothetical protein